MNDGTDIHAIENPQPPEIIQQLEERIKKTNYHGSKMQVRSWMMRDKIMLLRAQGMSFAKIAIEVDCHPQYAYKVYRKALKGLIVESTQEVRKVEGMRLDMLQDRVLQILQNPNPMISNGQVVYEIIEVDGVPQTDPDGRPLLRKVVDQKIVLDAVQQMLRIMERRARLLGLDAATKAEISGPNGGPIQSKVLQQMQPTSREQLIAAAKERGLPMTIFQTLDMPDPVPVSDKAPGATE